ncbi:MAG: sterol desaturase family protein [Acidobacteria bacterium]|nr:sterol desaturase family protein [Acidobacteriota bacterium]
MDYLVQNAGTVQWIAFAAAFLAIAVWETVSPLRDPKVSTPKRWGIHLVLLVLSGVLESFVLRITPLAAALAAPGWGLLRNLPTAAQWAAAILLLDLVHYGTHRLYHRVGFLWRLHSVHHSDPDFDVSTAVRFHPLEVILTSAIYVAAILVLAPPPAAVAAAELHTTLLNFFAHANARLPARASALLGRILITPGLHRLHHSIREQDQGKNLGQTFVWWDRLFGTYGPEPASGPVSDVGLEEASPEQATRIWFLFAEPFQPPEKR